MWPKLGLVCLTSGPEVRYRTITRTRLLGLAERGRVAALREIYAYNLKQLWGALDYCVGLRVEMYRVTSNLFPQVDHPSARAVLDAMKGDMRGFGKRTVELGVRVVIHPDQFVVLNSESPRVVEQSIGIMEQHGEVLDRLSLPRSTWAAMILHGGKSGRAKELVATIGGLAASVRSRLVLENDERAYGADEILSICRQARVPMVFDAHHHVVKERLTSYEDPSVKRYTRAARGTWDRKDWQLVHVSNGRSHFGDASHSDLIEQFPSAFCGRLWVEVEAKGKENAICGIQQMKSVFGAKRR
jgi:UV DNA damage endonuclease